MSIDEDNIVLQVELDGNPMAHERPRIGRGGQVYTPKKTATYKEELAWAIKLRMGDSHHQDAKILYGVQSLFYRSNKQRVDLDNLMKTLMDSITLSRFWKDDSQVREISCQLFTGQAKSKIRFVIYKIINGSTTGAPSEIYKHPSICAYCGKPIPGKSFPSTIRKYCSYECSVKAKRVVVVCKWCNKEFEIPQCHQIQNNGRYIYSRSYCSRACSMEHNREIHRIKGRDSDKWLCQICGGRVSRKEYIRCRACSMLDRGDPSSNYWKLRHKKEDDSQVDILTVRRG